MLELGNGLAIRARPIPTASQAHTGARPRHAASDAHGHGPTDRAAARVVWAEIQLPFELDRYNLD